MMGYILAYTLNYNNHDGRYSHSNREWADTTCKGERGSNIRTDWIVRSHPAVLNGFVDMYRKELAAEQQREPEKPFVQQFYVVTDLQTNPMKIEKFGNLDDAMSCYQQVPNFHLKALGVEKTPDPLPGSLDIVQCKNGIDTIVEDYKKVPGWDNPYIQNHVVALVAEALKVQDVAVAYEINDGYFHIQTSEDGYDYVNTTSVRTLPEDKWIIAENAHEAIVTKDEYYQAQKAIRNVTPIQYKVGDDFALKGKICCGNCNRQLRHERQYGEMVFYCGYKRSAGKFSKCYGGYYREYSVNAKVARAIKTVFYALDVVNQGMQEKQSITVRCMDIEDLEKQAEAIRVEQIKLYESYADGVLLRDAYIEKKKVLSEKLAALQDSIRIEKEEQECADELDEEIRALTKQASEKTYIGGLTKECVDAFVSMVYLYDDQTMKIEFNCEDVIRRALEKYGA